MTKVKICGITTKQEIEYLNEFKPDFAGFVMFFKKSKRNVDPNTAKKLLSNLNKAVKTVAVMVNPTIRQINTAKECGFDYVQVHGNAEGSLLQSSPLPVIKAFNVSDINRFDEYNKIDNIAGFLFDSAVPGSGKTFDWSLLEERPQNENKMFILAGGLNPDNVADAVERIKPDCVDVSSGVESNSGIGKSKKKIKEFIAQAKSV